MEKLNRNVEIAGHRPMRQRPLISLPGTQAFGWLAQCPSLFSIGNSRSNGPADRKRDFVLHCEDIGQVTVVTVGPDVAAGFRID